LVYNNKYWLSNLVLEAEVTITILPVHEQEHIRYQAAHNLQKLYKRYNEKHADRNKNNKNEYKILNQIKRTLSEANALVTRAAKETQL